MLSEDGGVATSATIPSSLTLPSKHALAFVNHVLQSQSDQVHLPLIKLIQHVCTKIPDKAEYRNKMAVVSRVSSKGGSAGDLPPKEPNSIPPPHAKMRFLGETW
jgi:hypothetical protein